MSVIDEIKARLDIVELIESYGVQLRKSGRTYSGFCPFHPNSRTPAFVVWPDDQSWYCFGACGEGGSAFDFVQKKEGWDFRETLVELAARTGVELTQFQKDTEQAPIEERLSALLSDAADYFHQLLYHAPQAEQARAYVRSRALTRGSVNNFKLGYALDSFEGLGDHFMAQGYSQQELIDAGLLTVNEDRGSVYDRFRDRLIFPIWDVRGVIVGFGARTLQADGVPKYLNSPQTTLFDKSSLLYGLHAAKRDIRQAREAVIVEGYMDVIRAHQAGFRNVIAQMGTALSERQLDLLKRYTQRFIIALDADEAGVRATLRSLEVARETLDREVEMRIDARGLLRQEARLKADIRIATLPAGRDPDDIIRERPQTWSDLLQQARPIVTYLIDHLVASSDLQDPKAKAEIARQIVPLIEDLANEVERRHYYKQLADRLGVEVDNLRRFKAATPKQQINQTQTTRRHSALMINHKMVAPRAIEQLEETYLVQALREPQIMVAVDLLLKKGQQPTVGKDDFTQSIDRALWQHLRQRAVKIGAGQVVTIEELCETVGEALRDRVHNLLQRPGTPSSQRDQLPHRLTRLILDLRYNKTRRLLSEVKQLLAEAKYTDDQGMSENYALKCQELSLMLYSIDQARRRE